MAKIEKGSGNNSTFEANPVEQVRLKENPTRKGLFNMEILQEASNAIIKLILNKHVKDEAQKIK